MTSDKNGDWSALRIQEVAEVVGGGTPSTKDPENFGGDVPWITPRDLASHNGREIERGERSITDKGLSSSSARLLPTGSVLVSSRAPIGYVAIAARPVTTNQGFRSLVLKDGHSPEFFYYLLRHSTEVLERNASGSTFREISGSALKRVEFLVPSPSIQRRIGSVLSVLDDKIESNRRVARTLQSLAQTLFRARFLPTFASGDSAESDPSALPAGWRVSPMGDVLRIVGGGTPSTKEPAYWEGGTHCWATPKDLSALTSPVLIETARKITDAGVARISSRLLPERTVLLSSRAPVGYTALTGVPVAVNQGFIAIPPSDGVPSEYVFFWLQQNIARIKGHAGGTTFAEISKRAFRPIPMLLPPPEELQDFQHAARPIFDLIAARERENLRLMAIRDELTPRLLSGQLSVPPAEDVTAEVA